MKCVTADTRTHGQSVNLYLDKNLNAGFASIVLLSLAVKIQYGYATLAVKIQYGYATLAVKIQYYKISSN